MRIAPSLLILAGVLLLVIGQFLLLHLALFDESAVRVPGDYASLQDALNAATPKTRILVDANAGPFNGSLSVNTPNITLTSVNGRAVLLGVPDMPVVRLYANSVSISGFEIRGGSSGLEIAGVSGGSLTGNLITQNVQGIGVIDSERISISQNQIIDNRSIGLIVHNSRLNNISENTISGNQVGGIFLEGDSRENTFEENVISDSDMGMRFITSPHNDISENSIKRNFTFGISVESSDHLQIASNYFNQNGTALDLVNGSHAKIRENRFDENGNGLWVHGAAQDLVISSNSFVENSHFALRNDAEIQIDARGNYWGTLERPPLCDALNSPSNGICGSVLFEPWLTNQVELESKK